MQRWSLCFIATATALFACQSDELIGIMLGDGQREPTGADDVAFEARQSPPL